MAAVNARAKAEAAQARAVFARKEIEMRVKQAELKVEETCLEATLEALHQQRDAEAALAEANVYEAAASEMDEVHMSGRLSQTFHPSERTSEYVKNQFLQNDKLTPYEDVKAREVPACSTFSQLKREVDMSDPISPYIALPPKNNGNDGASQPSQYFAVHEPPACSRPQIPSQENSNMSDLNRFLARHDQSNTSLARSSFFDIFGIAKNSSPYTLKTCAGVTEVTGRSASNFIVESADGRSSLPLPMLIECDMLPDNRNKIPTPEAAHYHPHLKDIAAEIPALDPQADILLLLGRDVIQAHKVLSQRNGPLNAPFAQKLALGWVIVGDACLGGAHKPGHVNVLKTNILDNGRLSNFFPCQNSIQVKESFSCQGRYKINSPVFGQGKRLAEADTMGKTVFQCTSADEKPAYSIEEQAFLQIMEREVYQDDTNSWVAPLPFRSPRQRLTNNKQQASLFVAR
ncbi:hypothetical protein SKAU_G00021980 [Synaphobranchus kaupii]|uniref:Uncharacterized protein n=1 Tax=Synaphobranchus kaupii TaxID=118154 RepID=A0A9Q1JDZ0_SYNKA|nr:hypothetical protein SKAU_G00021980 [Synaphobranchus kaupii]